MAKNGGEKEITLPALFFYLKCQKMSRKRAAPPICRSVDPLVKASHDLWFALPKLIWDRYKLAQVWHTSSLRCRRRSCCCSALSGSSLSKWGFVMTSSSSTSPALTSFAVATADAYIALWPLTLFFETRVWKMCVPSHTGQMFKRAVALLFPPNKCCFLPRGSRFLSACWKIHAPSRRCTTT